MLRARSLSMDILAKEAGPELKRALGKNWSSSSDVHTLLYNDFSLHSSLLHADADGLEDVDAMSSASDSTIAFSCPTAVEGLKSAGEAQSLFGSFYSSRSPSAHDGNDAKRKKEVDAWTAEEDESILSLVEQHGKRWSKIAASLPGRSDNGVRNRWNRIERANAMREAKGPDVGGYRCRRCGLPKRGHTCTALTQGNREDIATRSAELSHHMSFQMAMGAHRQQQDEASRPKLFEATGNVFVAVGRMEKNFSSSSSEKPPAFPSPSPIAAPVMTLGVMYEDVHAVRAASLEREKSLPTEAPIPDRHTGLSMTFGKVVLEPVSTTARPAECSDDPLSLDHLDDFLMDLHRSLYSPTKVPASAQPACSRLTAAPTMPAPTRTRFPAPPAMDHLHDNYCTVYGITDVEFLADVLL